jgi:hypothetical protein
MRAFNRSITSAVFLLVALGAVSTALAAGGPTPIGNFGPTGIDIAIQPDHTLKVLGVQPNSPADGMVKKGEVILQINGQPPLNETDFKGLAFQNFNQLAAHITRAEATNGILRCKVKPVGQGDAYEAVVKIPVLGAYSKTWPLNCAKTDKIVRANADYIASVAGEDGEGLTGHDLYNGFAILMLLSTGEQQDLDVVRRVYQARMASFDPAAEVGSHNWHNGLQGMAVCEYYLRTGDESVMPLIDAICEAIAKYQVHGGWSHWAKGINPQYTAGGLMNAAGIQNLTTLLLAKQCGANVDPEALDAAVKFFYRFAGHANVPYGDHRPEGGYGSNNGKTEMLALAMSIAARADNGEVYAKARDKSAQTALYNYPHMLRGHTGGNGAKWHGIAAALMADKKPDLYRNQLENNKWFIELSRRHTGAMGASGSGRYDKESYGYATGLMLTAPRKTLQITGAPTSPHAKSFRLPARPWGRAADLAFFNLDGGPAYTGPYLPPHIERAEIAGLDEAVLRRMASHPEHGYRETVADTIREKQLDRLIEQLLESNDPLAQHTGCMAINIFEPWGLRFHIGTRSRRSIPPERFTPRMFNALMDIVTDPTSALWSVDQALCALTVASTEQIKGRLDDILPWIEHPEWWLNESGTIALTSVMVDEQAMDIILPTLTHEMATNVHIKGRGVMGWMLSRATVDASPAIKQKVLEARIKVFEDFVSVESGDPEVDISGITSCALESALGGIIRNDDWSLREDPKLILKAAELTVSRIDEFRSRERGRVIDLLIDASDVLKGEDRKKMGRLLVQHFRPEVVGDDPVALAEQMQRGGGLGQMNKLLAIDEMAGVPGGWEMLGRAADGKQTWWHTSYEPKNKPADAEYNRYRALELPGRLADWYKVDYDPAKQGWKREQRVSVEGVAPKGMAVSKDWFADYLEGSGEAIFVRKTFELDDTDFAMMRLTVYSRQGYEVYLNGQKLVESKGRSKTWGARTTYFNDKMIGQLKVGKNVIAVRSFLQYFRGRDGGVDVFVEKLEQLPKVD